MPLLILFLIAVAIMVFGPTIWVRSVMRKHAGDRPDFPGTGGELARHLLDQAGLDAVAVEAVPAGDHYDPRAKAVRLSQENFDGRSLTAVAVAAHEVGHALQDRDGYKPLAWRTRLVNVAIVTDNLGSIALFGLSAFSAASLGPKMLLLGALAVVIMGGIRVAADAVTLPVEFDASFNRALPILAQGKYIHADDLPAARSILQAAAYTYVAGSALQVLNLFRLLRWLR